MGWEGRETIPCLPHVHHMPAACMHEVTVCLQQSRLSHFDCCNSRFSSPPTRPADRVGWIHVGGAGVGRYGHPRSAARGIGTVVKASRTYTIRGMGSGGRLAVAKGTEIRTNFGILNFRIFVFWNFGVLEFWNFGILEFSSFRILDFRISKFSNFRILEF